MFQQYVKGLAALVLFIGLACGQGFGQRKRAAAPATPPRANNGGGLSGLYTGERYDFTFVPNVFGAGGGSYQNRAVRLRFFFYRTDELFAAFRRTG